MGHSPVSVRHSTLAAAFLVLVTGCGLLLGDRKEPCGGDPSCEDAPDAAAPGTSSGDPADPAAPSTSSSSGSSGASPSPSATSSSGGAIDAGGDAATLAKNKTHCEKLGASGCSCDIPKAGAPPANDEACDANVGIGSICCAGSDWPAAGSSCSCYTGDCNSPGGGGCSCSLGFAGETCNDGTMCCVSPFGECLCTYQGTTCFRGYRQVTRCDAQAIGCRNGTKQVTSCALPR